MGQLLEYEMRLREKNELNVPSKFKQHEEGCGNDSSSAISTSFFTLPHVSDSGSPDNLRPVQVI